MNRLKKNEQGFGVIEIILVLIIVILLGVVGWFVYKNHHKTTNSTTTSTTSKTTSPTSTSTTNMSIPTGFIRYNNTNLGITFAYPKDWGTVSVRTLAAYSSNGSTTALSGVVGGYYGTFSSQSEVTFRAISKSNVHEPYGEVDPYLGSGFCVQGNQIILEDANLTPLPAQNGVVDYHNSGATCSRAVTLVSQVKANKAYVVKVSCQQGCTDYLMALARINTVQHDISTIALTSTDTTQDSTLGQILNTIAQL